MSRKTRNLFQLLMDSQEKLVALIGDKKTHADYPIDFSPSPALISAVSLALTQEINSGRTDSFLIQLALENLETAYVNLIQVLGE